MIIYLKKSLLLIGLFLFQANVSFAIGDLPRADPSIFAAPSEEETARRARVRARRQQRMVDRPLTRGDAILRDAVLEDMIRRRNRNARRNQSRAQQARRNRLNRNRLYHRNPLFNNHPPAPAL